jgi:putative acetyltransferase
MSETLIRPETPDDIDAVRAINIAAFADHPVSQQTEHLIVDALRDEGALSVSLVAVRDGQPVGHIAFSEAVVGEMTEGWYLVGPVAVLPEFQHQGIGCMLVAAGLAELQAREATGCVLVGDPGFYQRFGFGVHPGLAYQGVPDEFVLGLPFGDEAPAGGIAAHRAFEVQPQKG